jgi:hypothetical protein
MSDVKVNAKDTRLEWHSVEETPPLHTVKYAGEIWLQSTSLLLVNAAGKNSSWVLPARSRRSTGI